MADLLRDKIASYLISRGDYAASGEADAILAIVRKVATSDAAVEAAWHAFNFEPNEVTEATPDDEDKRFTRAAITAALGGKPCTTLDRAARALLTCEAWSSFWSEDDARVLVRAVLAALAEPTPGMVEAGELSIDDCVVTHTVPEAQAVRDVWAAMLAAAREGK